MKKKVPRDRFRKKEKLATVNEYFEIISTFNKKVTYSVKSNFYYSRNTRYVSLQVCFHTARSTAYISEVLMYILL